MFHSALLITCLAGVTLAGVIPGPTLVRLPAQDSAVIQHERLGGNFAYSAHEAHAYGVQTPVVEQRVVPQGFSFVQGTPQVRTHTTVQKHLVPQYGVVRTQHTVPVVSQVQVSNNAIFIVCRTKDVFLQKMIVFVFRSHLCFTTGSVKYFRVFICMIFTFTGFCSYHH